MDHVATWPRRERETLFLDSVERLPHLSPALIEKDFWVCWLLRRLFLLDQEIPLIFKGAPRSPKPIRSSDASRRTSTFPWIARGWDTGPTSWMRRQAARC